MLQENDPKLQSWLARAQEKINVYFAKYFPDSLSHKLSIQVGRHYIKIIEDRSAFAFIDRTNGDVLKAASWKAPAKHARGNIFDKHNGLALVDAHGPVCLR